MKRNITEESHDDSMFFAYRFKRALEMSEDHPSLRDFAERLFEDDIERDMIDLGKDPGDHRAYEKACDPYRKRVYRWAEGEVAPSMSDLIRIRDSLENDCGIAVSIDWLVGASAYKREPDEAASKALGLSEAAVETLRRIKRERGSEAMETLSAILSDEAIDKLVDNVSAGKKAHEDLLKIENEFGSDAKNIESLRSKTSTAAAVQVITKDSAADTWDRMYLRITGAKSSDMIAHAWASYGAQRYDGGSDK